MYRNMIVYLVTVAYKGELYILGGYNGCHDLHFDDMHKFNPGLNGGHLY